MLTAKTKQKAVRWLNNTSLGGTPWDRVLAPYKQYEHIYSCNQAIAYVTNEIVIIISRLNNITDEILDDRIQTTYKIYRSQ